MEVNYGEGNDGEGNGGGGGGMMRMVERNDGMELW
jgi:hypothetical protein